MLDLYYFYLQDLQIKRNHQTSHGWDISAKPSWHLLATCHHKLQKCFHKAERLPLLNYLMLVCFDNYLFVWVYLLVQGVKSLIHICQGIFLRTEIPKALKTDIGLYRYGLFLSRVEWDMIHKYQNPNEVKDLTSLYLSK